MLNYLKAYLRGMIEFRRTFVTHYDDYDCLVAYDRGCDMAHRLTLRRFDY